MLTTAKEQALSLAARGAWIIQFPTALRARSSLTGLRRLHLTQPLSCLGWMWLQIRITV